MEAFEVAEVVEIRVEEAVVRHGRSARHLVRKDMMLLYPHPHEYFS